MKRLQYFVICIGLVALLTAGAVGLLGLIATAIDWIFGKPTGGVALLTLLVAAILLGVWNLAGELASKKDEEQSDDLPAK
jgi:hypothetical protein